MKDIIEKLEKAVLELSGEPSEENATEALILVKDTISALRQPAVSGSLPSDVYTELDIDKAYKCGERQSTFYKKNGTVILPRNYEGVDG